MWNMRRTVLVLILVNAGLVAGSQASNRAAAPATEAVVRTNMLERVDAIGMVRSRLSVAPDGEVVLRLIDRSGSIRVWMILARDRTENRRPPFLILL